MLMSLIADHTKGGALSPTFKLAAKARELTSKGVEILDLSIGDPECETPQNVKEAAYRAIKENKTKYTATDGITELKEAIYEKYRHRIGEGRFSVDNIIVSSGAKYILHSCFWATLNKGDEVILPAPYWVSYGPLITLNGGVPINIDCEEQNDFKFTIEALEKVVTKKSKWLLINSPNNPTGAQYSKAELKEIAAFVKKHDNLHVLSDDIYEEFSYENESLSMIDVVPELWDKLFIINGVSKTYAMTGWRIGYGIGNKELVNAMKVMQSQTLSGPCSVSQYAALEALTGDQSSVKNYRQLLQKRRDLSYEFFKKTEGFSCTKPPGAFYVFPNCSAFINSVTPHGQLIKDDTDFCDYLLEEENIFVVPGSAFGGENYFRLSYAVSDDVLQKALNGIKRAVAKLKLR